MFTQNGYSWILLKMSIWRKKCWLTVSKFIFCFSNNCTCPLFWLTIFSSWLAFSLNLFSVTSFPLLFSMSFIKVFSPVKKVRKLICQVLITSYSFVSVWQVISYRIIIWFAALLLSAWQYFWWKLTAIYVRANNSSDFTSFNHKFQAPFFLTQCISHF